MENQSAQESQDKQIPTKSRNYGRCEYHQCSVRVLSSSWTAIRGSSLGLGTSLPPVPKDDVQEHYGGACPGWSSCRSHHNHHHLGANCSHLILRTRRTWSIQSGEEIGFLRRKFSPRLTLSFNLLKSTNFIKK